MDLWSSLRALGSKVWLDVKMDRRDEDAMREGVKNSDAVVAILSELYFQRPFCIKEIVWACEFGKPVIPCVPSDLKGFIGEFGGQPPRDGGEPSVAAAPEFLRGILSINFEELNRSDNEFWNVCVNKVRKAQRKKIPLRLPDGVTLDDGAAAAQTEVRARVEERAEAARKEAEELGEVRRELEARKKRARHVLNDGTAAAAAVSASSSAPLSKDELEAAKAEAEEAEARLRDAEEAQERAAARERELLEVGVVSVAYADAIIGLRDRRGGRRGSSAYVG